MAKSKLNIEETLKIRKVFWRRLSQHIKKWILKDMIKGKVQEYTSFSAIQYTKQYAKYKANNMRRFTNNKGKKLKTRELKGTRAKINQSFGLQTSTTSGKRLKGYEGKSIRSNKVGSVNMYLTGELINGLHYYRSTDRVLELKYATKDEGKILGNPDRLITTLNEENTKKTKREYENEINRNVKEWAKKKVYITAGK